jgi:AhpD family alkylhydroperoxidase
MKLIRNAVVAGIAQYKRDLATARTPVNPFRGRTITPLGFVGELAAIAAQRSTFSKVWVKRELDPRFRETLMLAIARLNESRYCSWAHHEWASIEGVSERQLAHIEQMDPAHFDRRTWVALTFVCELVSARFEPVSKKTMQQMRAHYTAAEIDEITLVAKVMDAANRSSNTFDALLARLDGRASTSSGIVDEAIMAAAFCAVLPPLLAYFSYASKRPVDELLRRMIAYTGKMEAEQSPAAPGGEAPVPARRRRAPAAGKPAGAGKPTSRAPKAAARGRKQAARVPAKPAQRRGKPASARGAAAR